MQQNTMFGVGRVAQQIRHELSAKLSWLRQHHRNIEFDAADCAASSLRFPRGAEANGTNYYTPPAFSSLARIGSECNVE